MRYGYVARDTVLQFDKDALGRYGSATVKNIQILLSMENRKK
jgi:hypothetical protein